jgi:hypothetical protein
MRSRLEARWAAFFDLIGWTWVYEPYDYDGWIPDFFVHGNHPFYVEVGPCSTLEEFEAKSAKAAANGAVVSADVLVLGVSPLPDISAEGSGSVVAGLIGERNGVDLWFDRAMWAWDGKSLGPNAHYSDVLGREDGLSVYHCYGWYDHRPGPGHENALPDRFRRSLMDLWSEAGSQVQWHRT